jgi:hypothetical protein
MTPRGIVRAIGELQAATVPVTGQHLEPFGDEWRVASS